MTFKTLDYKSKQVLLKIAIADAYGMGFEFVPQEIVNTENDLKTYRPHGKHSDLVPGQYTDDTQMSIAIYEYLEENVKDRKIGKADFKKLCNKERIADKFLEVFKRDPRKGYAKGFQYVLETAQSGKEVLDMIDAYGRTESNGAAMRSVPIGLFFRDFDQADEFAKAQAEVTHQGSGVIVSQVVAYAAQQLFMYGRNIFEDHCYDINENLEVNNKKVKWHEWDGSRVASKTELGVITVKAAIHCVATTQSYKECLQKAVSFGGDTDSVAAIACGLSALNPEHEQIIPPSLLNGLERGEYGLGYLYNK